jgi:hypothetical protein
MIAGVLESLIRTARGADMYEVRTGVPTLVSGK